MTRALVRAFPAASLLPEREQEELEDEARAEHEAGETEPLDPDAR